MWTFAAGIYGVYAVRRLYNGHTLTNDQGNGRLIEVTPTSHLVWRHGGFDTPGGLDVRRRPADLRLVTEPRLRNRTPLKSSCGLFGGILPRGQAPFQTEERRIAPGRRRTTPCAGSMKARDYR